MVKINSFQENSIELQGPDSEGTFLLVCRREDEVWRYLLSGSNAQRLADYINGQINLQTNKTDK